MSKLFDNSDSETEIDIRTDNCYAKNYDNWRQKEELNKLKTKYGEEILDLHDSSTSSSENEDDEAVQITEQFEKDFFKTLASLKTKDPKIYNENINFFQETSSIDAKKIKKKDQPMYIKDYERKLLLENNAHVSDLEENISEPKSLTYIEEQEKLKNILKDALKAVDDDDDETNETNWGGIFKNRKKTNAELETEEKGYNQWLLGQNKNINEDIKNDLKPLKDFWNDPKLDENEKFLRDYILNKRFMESANKDYIPTYEEVIHDSDEGLSEDEKQIEKQEEFEYKYNYRFEEPDQEFIKRYPRTIENSLRRKNDKRKIKRVEIKERKDKEKQKRMEEIKQMQALKKKEIEEKIQKLKEITGNNDIEFDDNDIDGDFDPEAHDRRMQDLFSDKFYQGPEEQQKPEFPDLDEELEIENWEKYTPEENKNTANEPHCEDEDFNMDCDYDPTIQKGPSSSKGKKKRKRKSKFSEALNDPKPIFKPEDKTYEEYLDEYYKLDCEDIIGDIPCRFKYRKVIPNSFGLTIEEILMANDRELNKWCSLKKAIQYRQENVEKYDVIAFEKKSRNEALKKKILPSLFKQHECNQEIEKLEKNNKKKIRLNTDIQNEGNKSMDLKYYTPEETHQKVSINNTSTINNACVVTDSNVNERTNKEKKKNKFIISTNVSLVNSDIDENYKNLIQSKKRKRKSHKTDLTRKLSEKKMSRNGNFGEISDARLKAFGFKPKRFKNKIKYGQKKC